jgi:nucleoside-diphosphate-sugar epimerase
MIANSKCCVLGGAGFLGSHLVDHLIEDRNCEVLVLDNFSSGSKEFLNPEAKFIYFDITLDEERLRDKFIEHKIEYVFNYAAIPYIPDSFKRPLFVFNVNAFGALKVLNAAHEAGVKGILQVSSAEIYGEADGKISEDTPVIPHSSYGVSKVAIDGMVQVGWKERGTPAIAMRQFNCYGPRETHPYVIPEIISQLSEGNAVKLGNNSTRDFQFAGDAVRMAVELLENGKYGEVYNMGSEETIKIYDLAELIGKLLGKEIKIIPDKKRMRPWEIWHLQSDNTKLYKAIKKRPETPFAKGLIKTIEDFNKNGWIFKR